MLTWFYRNFAGIFKPEFTICRKSYPSSLNGKVRTKVRTEKVRQLKQTLEKVRVRKISFQLWVRKILDSDQPRRLRPGKQH